MIECSNTIHWYRPSSLCWGKIGSKCWSRNRIIPTHIRDTLYIRENPPGINVPPLMTAKVIRKASGEWMVFHRFQPTRLPCDASVALPWHPAALVTTDHLPIYIPSSFIYVCMYVSKLSGPDGRIPTTFSHFPSDSDTLLTFSTLSQLPPFLSYLAFCDEASIDPECSRLFRIG